MIVRFKNVGRAKVGWTQEVPGQSPLEEILDAVVRKRVLMSQGIEVVANDAGDGGYILVGGFRQVGTFEVL